MRHPTRSTSVLCAAIALLGFARCCLAAEVPGTLLPLLAQRAAIASELAKPIGICVSRKDSSHDSFHGCLDWHSAVHGVWALIAYTRATGDSQYLPLIKEVLSPERLALEQDMIAADRRFEMPYGRAWFLRLAIDYERLFHDEMLTPFGDRILKSMIAYYQNHTPDPRRNSYASDSWALINMYDYSVATQNSPAAAIVRELTLKYFVQYDGHCSYELEAGNFMAVCTNWAWLVSKVLPRDQFDKWSDDFFSKAGGLPRPLKHPLNDHAYGLNFSRAWGLWGIYSVTGRLPYVDAYVDHFEQSYSDPVNWKGSYQAVGHWVPQFGMFALQPLFSSQAD